MLAPLCAAWREEPLCREDANSEAWRDCASPRLLTQCHLLGLPSSLCVHRCAYVHTHGLRCLLASFSLQAGQQHSLNSCFMMAPSPSGQLLQQEAVPLLLQPDAHLALRAPLEPSTFPPSFTSILPGPSTLLGPPCQDPHNSRCRLLQGRRDHDTHLMRHYGKFNIIILGGRPLLAWSQG